MNIFGDTSVQNLNYRGMLAQVQQFFQKKGQDKTAQVQARAQARLNSINYEADKWRKLRTDLAEPKRAFRTAANDVSSIRLSANTLLSTIERADVDPDIAVQAAAYRATFESVLKSLRGLAGRVQNGVSLTGPAGVGVRTSVEYPVNINRLTRTVPGSDMGADYYIVDSTGKRWQPEHKSGQLVRYDDYPATPSSTRPSMVGGVRLDSLVGDAISFTVGPETAAPEAISGTIVRSGLGILDPWLYDNLETAGGRARARADLEAARMTLGLEKRRYEIAMSTVGFYDKRAEVAVDGFQKQANAKLAEQAAEIRKAEETLQLEYHSLAMALQGKFRVQRQYAKFFGFGNDPFIKALMDINA